MAGKRVGLDTATRMLGERSAAMRLGISRTTLRRVLKLGTDALSRSVRKQAGVRSE
jgi:DNA-binding FadR family transcriptional regulator